ncbi:hypothetical protein CLV00_1830 [Flavobacterium sp. 11]|nr:hypothetical protein CLV00_1830 [Flavobacterium sp. 11]
MYSFVFNGMVKLIFFKNNLKNTIFLDDRKHKNYTRIKITFQPHF